MTDPLPDLGAMSQKLTQLLELLRTTSAGATGSEREIADSLISMLQTAGADFFTAAAAMQPYQAPAPAGQPAPMQRPTPDALPDDLGPRLRDELIRRYPPAPMPEPDETLTEGSLWRELARKDEPIHHAPPAPPPPPPPPPVQPKEEAEVTEGSLWRELFKD